MHKYRSVSEMVNRLRPLAPVQCFRKSLVTLAAQHILSSSQGRVLYAVKTNPEPEVLKELYNAGIRSFDVASLSEIQLISYLFSDASMCFMNPVKSRESIRSAYSDFGIRDFSLDSFDELAKIVAETGCPADLGLHVRVAIPNPHAGLDLSTKFGATPEEAVVLLREARTYASRLGVCFHVGSQCMSPSAYAVAIKIAREIVTDSEVTVDVLDIGGGLPSTYPGMVPPPLGSYFHAINRALRDEGFDSGYELWSEPGRALVAESGSLVVRVELRKGNSVYINDGTYGGLFDAGHLGMIPPTKLIRPGGGEVSDELLPFSFFGPTCDSLDSMKGPFLLPADLKEGDYIEIGQMGAYSASMRTRFNGFAQSSFVEVEDLPMMSLYLPEESTGVCERRV